METVLQFLRQSAFPEYNLGIAIVGLVFGIFWFLVYNIYVLWDINDIGAGKRTIDVTPKSISQTYYLIEVRWLFQMFMWSSIFAIICVGQNMCYLLAGVCFGVMTCNPSVNGGNIYFIPHMCGAITATVLCLLGLGVTFNLWWITLLSAVLIPVVWIAARNDKNVVYVVEMMSYITLFIGFASGVIERI